MVVEDSLEALVYAANCLGQNVATKIIIHEDLPMKVDHHKMPGPAYHSEESITPAQVRGITVFDPGLQQSTMRLERYGCRAFGHHCKSATDSDSQPPARIFIGLR